MQVSLLPNVVSGTRVWRVSKECL